MDSVSGRLRLAARFISARRAEHLSGAAVVVETLGCHGEQTPHLINVVVPVITVAGRLVLNVRQG